MLNSNSNLKSLPMIKNIEIYANDYLFAKVSEKKITVETIKKLEKEGYVCKGIIEETNELLFIKPKKIKEKILIDFPYSLKNSRILELKEKYQKKGYVFKMSEPRGKYEILYFFIEQS